jgi:cephalosporin-C deacetylase-like acetyl esterase
MLSRRELLALSAIRLAEGAYRDYSRCLPDYLGALAAEAYERRNRELSKMTSASAVEARQRWVTETFWQLTGGRPERTPLNARVTGRFDRAGYRLEKVVYESFPGLHISANLYVPAAGEGPFPGVLFQMGHALDGKANALYQRCCQGLARLGFLVLGFDPMGQGERTYYPGENPSRTRLGSADEEHTYPGRQMLLTGDTSTRLQTWDAVRSLDYLASHQLVDPKRLASTGQSGGGTNTMLLAAVDNRLAAAAISCANTENVACANFNPPGSTDDGEQNFVASGPVGFDRWDLLYPLAPKPLLVMVSEKDWFGTYSPNYIANGQEEFAKLKRVYGVLGKAQAIEWMATPLPHGLAYDFRLAIYRWFTRWLKPGVALPDAEPPTEPETEKALFVSDSGNVVRSFGGATPFSLQRRNKLCTTGSGCDTRNLADLLQIETGGGAMATTGKATFRETDVEAVEFQSARQVFIPAWLFIPRAKARGIIIACEPNGRQQWHEGELYDNLAGQGYVVCAPDLRGIGDTTPEFSRGAARHSRPHNSDEHWSWACLTFGRPLAGQRTSDLLAMGQGLRQRFAGLPLMIAARHSMTVPGLLAAALDRNASALYLSSGLLSFRSIVESEEYSHPFGNFVPGLLRAMDLPEIAGSLKPRHVTIAGAVNAVGKRLPAEAVRQTCPFVNVVAEPAWDAQAITRAFDTALRKI